MNRSQRTLSWASVVLGLLLAGCAGKKQQPPFAAGALEPMATHFAGDALAGATGVKPASISLDQAAAVRVTFVALERMPAAAGKPLGILARLIVANGAGGPILPSPLLTRDTRMLEVAPSDEALAQVLGSVGGQHDQVAVLHGMLAPGLTASFAISEPMEDGLKPALQTLRRIEVSARMLSANAPRYELALMVDDVPAAAATSEFDRLSVQKPAEPAPAATAPPAIQRELAVWERAMKGRGDSLALVLPFKSGAAQAILSLIEISPANNDEEQREALAGAMAQAGEVAEMATKRPRVASLAIAETPGFSVMFANLGRAETRRAALAFLSSRAAASVCEDLSLVADDALLEAMVAGVQKNMGEFAAARTPAELAWLLERTALQLLAELADKGKLAAELQAVLARNLGEAGRQTASIQEVLRGSQNRAMLESHIVAENLIFLEDASPASRVRAYDWLLSRNQAPAGYDPLAKPRERRDALEKFRTAATGGKP